MKSRPRHILPAALLISAAFHLLVYGSLIVYLGGTAAAVRMGEEESSAVYIEVGLVAAAPAVPPEPPDPEPEPDPAEAESAIEIAAPLSEQDRIEEPPVALPPEESGEPALPGRAGREDLTAGPAGDEYLRRVRQRIEEQTYYPRRARLSRLEGAVRIGFSIAPGGEVRQPELLEPSPHGLFNRAALDILDRSGPFPPPVPGIEGKPISVSISFESTY